MKFEELIELIKNDPSFDLDAKIEKYMDDIENCELSRYGSVDEVISELNERLLEAYLNENNLEGVNSVLNSLFAQKQMESLILNLRVFWSENRDNPLVKEQAFEIIDMIDDKDIKGEIAINATSGEPENIIDYNGLIQIIRKDPEILNTNFFKKTYLSHFPGELLMQLLLELKTNEEIKEIIPIMDTVYMPYLINEIAQTDNEEIKQFIVKEINRLRTIKLDIKKLLLSIKDKKFVQDTLLNPNIAITEKERVNTVIELQDNDFIKYFIERYNGPFYLSGSLVELITSLNDAAYIMDCIKNNPSLSSKDRILLLLSTKDVDAINKWIENEQDEKVKTLLKYCIGNGKEYNPVEEITHLSIPKELRLGIEIECGGKGDSLIYNGIQKYNEGRQKDEIWKAGPDGSGLELASPILDPSIKSAIEIYRTCEFLQDMGMQCTHKDGGHIHFGADYFEHKQGEPYFDTKNAYINLIEIFSNCEKIFYAISNEPGQAPRGEMIPAEPISRKSFRKLR